MNIFNSNHEEMAYRAKLAAMDPFELFQEYYRVAKAQDDCWQSKPRTLEEWFPLSRREGFVEQVIRDRIVVDLDAASHIENTYEFIAERELIHAMWVDAERLYGPYVLTPEGKIALTPDGQLVPKWRSGGMTCMAAL